MHPHRLRGGALAWLLTLQFFVAETIVQARLDVPYSRADDVISALGTAVSPAALLMNASFALQAVLIAAGLLLLRPLLAGTAGAATVLLGACAAGVLLVGVFSSDGNAGPHAFGAVLHLLGGGLGLLALAYALRRRSEALGTALALLGLIGAGSTVFFLTDITEYLGRGGTERAAAYVLPIGLALAGAALWRLGGAPVDAVTDRGAARQAERDRARAAKEARDRARDDALEAAARRAEDHRAEGPGDDDPWAPPGRS